MIDALTVQRILDSTEIVDVISEFVVLKKRGTSLIGLCPFHNEKTPSFNVSRAKGMFKCFGCGKGGSAVNFIMEHEHYSYTEALKWLGRKYHIEVKEKEQTPQEIEERNEQESQLIVSEFAQKYFAQQLWETNTGRLVGLSYLRERGIRDDIIKKFGIGYCPDGKDPFTAEAVKAGYQLKFLEKTGLTIRRDEWIRDRFAGRVMFPIHNISGRVIGFGGRTLLADKTIAKYLNSPESEIYHKSRVLYGIYQAKRSIISKDKCYLVEGYTDVTSLHQSGIENVVASSGTSLTIEQIRLLRRFTSNVTIIYDGDQAGIKASMRGIDMVLEEGINVKVLPLPEGEDPDTFSRSMGASQLESYIKDNETDFIKFKTQLLLSGVENDPLSRASLISDIVSSISKVSNDILRTEYLKECSKLLNVSEEVLYYEIRKLKIKAGSDLLRAQEREMVKETIEKKEVISKPAHFAYPCAIEEKEVLKLLLKYGSQPLFEDKNEETGEEEVVFVAEYILSELQADHMNSSDPVIRQIFDEYHQHLGEESFDGIKYFINHSDNQVSHLVTDILSEKNKLSAFWKKRGNFIEEEHEILHQLIPRILQEYKLRFIANLISQTKEEISKAALAENYELISDLQLKYQKLKSVEAVLCDKLNKRIIRY